MSKDQVSFVSKKLSHVSWEHEGNDVKSRADRLLQDRRPHLDAEEKGGKVYLLDLGLSLPVPVLANSLARLLLIRFKYP